MTVRDSPACPAPAACCPGFPLLWENRASLELIKGRRPDMPRAPLQVKVDHTDAGGSCLLTQNGKDVEVELGRGPSGAAELSLGLKGQQVHVRRGRRRWQAGA